MPSPSFTVRALAGAAQVALLTTLIGIGPAAAPLQAQELFPEPFLVEHRIVQHDAGEPIALEPVVDRYGGSWIVSERPDGSRLVVDLERRRLTEIRPAEGSYSVLDFDRLATLQRRLAGLLELDPTAPQGVEEKLPQKRTDDAALWVSELPPRTMDSRTADSLARKSGAALQPWAAAEVRRFRVDAGVGGPSAKAATTEDPLLEAWVTPAVRLRPKALAAIEAWERSLNGGDGAPAVAAVRRQAGGELVVKTRRPVASGSDGVFTVEDETLRLERLEAFPLHLVEVPVGLRQVPHGLEIAVATLEAELRFEKGFESGEGGR